MHQVKVHAPKESKQLIQALVHLFLVNRFILKVGRVTIEVSVLDGATMW